jgi:peroxiredoxin
MRKMILRIGFVLTLANAIGQCETVTAILIPAVDRKPAAEFALKNARGKTVTLSSYRGKIVLVDFWATECGGCVKEIPSFMELAEGYRSRPLAVVGVSIEILYEDLKGPEEAWARVIPFVQSHNVKYPVLMGDDHATKAYDIKALPLTFLIDRRGRTAATYQGIVDMPNLKKNIELLLHNSSK